MDNISIYGAGHLTQSLLCGLAEVSKKKILVFNRTHSKIDNLKNIYHNLEIKDHLEDLIDKKTVVFCLVPGNAILNMPINFIELFKKTNSILVSCANGLSLELLNNKFEGIKIIRLLPNINWQVCQGVTLFDFNNRVTQEEIIEISCFLNPVTKMYHVKNELDFDKIGTLSTCSPGLFCTILDYFNKYFELTDLQEREIFYETIRGTIEYILQSKKDLQTIISEIANIGGLTEVGINALKNEFPHCMDALTISMGNKVQERKKIYSLKFL